MQSTAPARSRPAKAWWLRLCACLALLGVNGAALPASPAGTTETVVRAAFLFRLTFFLSWPDAAFSAPDSAIRLCIREGTDAGLFNVLSEQVAKRKAQGRPLEVVRVAADDADAVCHVLYLGTETAAANGDGAYAMVVVDSLNQLERVGAIALVREDQPGGGSKLVFYAHPQRLKQSVVGVSAKLLQLLRMYEVQG